MKEALPAFLTGSLLVLIHGLALLVTRPFGAAGMTVFENPNDPMNLVYFFFTLVFFTVSILLIARFWKKQLIQAIVLGAIGLTAFYVFYPLLVFIVPESWSVSLSIAAVAVLIMTLLKHPEWYVIDVCGIAVGAGTIAMLGISLSIPLSIVLLIGLAIYDAISVYKTKHMIDLADTFLDLKLPILLVIPKTRKYSLIKETERLKEKLRNQEEKDAFFMGLGDVIIPGILAACALYNIHDTAVALSTMAGTLLGFAFLVASVSKGKPQAGLPYLCSGALLGYSVSSYAVSGKLIELALAMSPWFSS